MLYKGSLALRSSTEGQCASYVCSCCTCWVQDDAAAPSDAESDDGEAERMVSVGCFSS